MIELKGATMRYRDRDREVLACDSVDLQLKSGEFLGILGPSGSGKSTLLYLLSGLKTPSAGAALYNSVEYSQMPKAERDRIRLEQFGFVFQQPYLLGYLNALENVMLGNPRIPDRELASALLDSLGLGDKSFRRPHELSGGERQRVCVARALFGEPVAVFADEPTASLDRKRGHQVVDLLVKNRGNGSLALVTHDPEMLEHADRIVEISDGRLVAAG